MISLSDLRINYGYVNPSFYLRLQMSKGLLYLFSIISFLTFSCGFFQGYASNSGFPDLTVNESPVMGMNVAAFEKPTGTAAVVDPNITVRFANPQFNCTTYEYCLDVEFQADLPNTELFLMNVRFFLDDNILEFINLRNFQGGYAAVTPNPAAVSYSTAGIPWFNFSGGADYVNGAAQKTNGNAPPIYISTSSWTKLFQSCFSVDYHNGSETNFCPPLVWDLEQNEDNGGFPPGSAGVVMTVVDGAGLSAPVFEHVSQFNWQYIGSGSAPFGQPIASVCSSIDCGSCNLLVNNTSNSGAGSLKAAIQCAYSGDTIKFATNLAGSNIVVSGATIPLSKSLFFRSNLSPRLKISSTIAGLFEILHNTSVEFKDIDITSGTTVSGNLGAAFRNDGTLKLINVNVFKHASLPLGQYLIRNRPTSTLSLTGNCFIEIP